jgi:hypothetical protein
MVRVKLPNNCIDLNQKIMFGMPMISIIEDFFGIKSTSRLEKPGHGVTVYECDKNGNVEQCFLVNYVYEFVINREIYERSIYKIEFDYICLYVD